MSDEQSMGELENAYWEGKVDAQQRITELEQGIKKCVAWCDACAVHYHAIEELRALVTHD